jgi:hypothetical protein
MFWKPSPERGKPAFSPDRIDPRITGARMSIGIRIGSYPWAKDIERCTGPCGTLTRESIGANSVAGRHLRRIGHARIACATVA